MENQEEQQWQCVEHRVICSESNPCIFCEEKKKDTKKLATIVEMEENRHVGVEGNSGEAFEIY